MKYVPSLDKNFKPAALVIKDFMERVSKSNDKAKLSVCLERTHGYNYTYNLELFKDNTGHDDENFLIVERIVKSLLWLVGGYKIYIAGSPLVAKHLKDVYSEKGERAFDFNFMSNVYENKFEIIETTFDKLPEPNSQDFKLDNGLEGCRIGFDAGGSDRKVSAVIDG